MKKSKKYLLLGVIISIGFLLLHTFSIAKFVSNFIWDYYLKTKGFYFKSEQLSYNDFNNVNYLWDGGKVYFNLKNNLNERLVTSTDIEYEVSCTIKGEEEGKASCFLEGTETSSFFGVLSSNETCFNQKGDGMDVSSYSQVQCEADGYDWALSPVSDQLFFEIIPHSTYELKEVEVVIEVSSLKPYKKTLTGTFILNKYSQEIAGITMEYKQYDTYDKLLVINSTSEEKDLKITWSPLKLIVDVDDDDIITYITNDHLIEGIHFKIEGKESKGFIFYKKDKETNYDLNDFTLEDLNF